LRRVLFYFGDFIIVNTKKIFGIIITSSILGLVINYFNPEGIPLIREKLELKWAPDSLFLESIQDTIAVTKESTPLINSTKNEEHLKFEIPATVNNKEENNTTQKEPQKIAEEIKEANAFTEPKAITLEQAYKLFNKGVKFIDARDEVDYLAGHITNSVNIPFDDFDNHKQKLEQLSKEKPLVIYCAGTDCDLSILLGNLLFEQGYKQVYIFFGGWNEWLNANYPTEQSSE
jgi:rhodanese-related sulfurtransferase